MTKIKEKLSIHRALSELKLIDSKITKKIDNFVPVSFATKTGLVNHKTKEEFSKTAKEDYQSINDLIGRKSRIKTAIVLSNASTQVTIGDKTLSVADAITLKSYINLNNQLKNKMSEIFKTIKSNIEYKNSETESLAISMSEKMVSKESKTSAEELTAHRNAFMSAHEISLVDPLSIEKEINKLDEEVSNFTSEVDAVLSESNAITIIEF